MSKPANADRGEKTKPSLRQTAIDVLKALTDAGHIAYFAGGCVRDRLLGLEPTDYDIATDANPDQVRKVFPRVHTVGESFGVMLVRLNGYIIQVATFRTEGVYSDGRHPDSVTFSDAQHDAGRRDFTINGLFEDPVTNQIIDYVGGRTDLEARLIRAIGDPEARLREDQLRMLRAIRFMAKFGFSLDPDTAKAISESSHRLNGVSRERIGEELRRMLVDANRAVAAWELQYHGLDSVVLLEDRKITAPSRLGRLPDDIPYPTALAAWLLDRHGEVWDDLQLIALRWVDALMLSNEERWFLTRNLENYQTLMTTWPRLGVAKQKRLAASEGFDQALALLQATDRQCFVDVRRHVIDLSQSGLSPTPFIDGSDLIAMGLKPGPVFTRVLEAVYDAQLEGSIEDKPEALALAKAVAATPLDRRTS